MGILGFLNKRKKQAWVDCFASMGDLEDLEDRVEEQLGKISVDMKNMLRDLNSFNEFRSAQSTVNKHLIDRLQKAGMLPPEDPGGDVSVG